MKKIGFRFILCLVLAVCMFFVSNNIYAVELVEIQIQDENLFNILCEKYESEFWTYSSNDRSIKMTQNDFDNFKQVDIKLTNDINISDLKKFSNLNTIFVDLNGNNITGLESLSELTNLNCLSLHGGNIQNLNWITGFTNLKELWLFYNQISDISAISSLNNLEDLNLDLNNISDISPLTNLANLKKLSLETNIIENIDVISNLVNLKDLNLGINKISDVSFLKNLGDLEILTLNSNEILDIKDLKDLTNLKTLDLGHNNISDISDLRNLTSLEALNLNWNNITDITPLENMVNMKSLYLGNNNISCIDSLQNLVNLENLSLEWNNITDISPLLGKTKLDSVNLESNNISDISYLKDMSKSKILWIGSNKIADCSIIDNELKDKLVNIVNQEIEIQSESRVVDLPYLFSNARNTDSKLYSSEELECVNCVLSEDGTKAIVNDDVSTASIKIKEGIAYNSILNINIVPEGELTLSYTLDPDTLTNKDVVVTIKSNKKVNKSEGWEVSLDQYYLTKIFKENGSEKVTVTDIDGNSKEITVIVKNIDKDPPVVEYKVHKNEDRSVDVYLIANEKIREVDGWKLLDDKQTLLKTFYEDSEENVQVFDLAGNYTDVKVNVSIEKESNISIETDKVEKTSNPKTGNYLIYELTVLIIAVITFSVTKLKRTN